jgi:hypothetical protein
MTTTALFCFVAIVLGATLRALVPRRAAGEPRRRRGTADVVVGRPVETLDLVGERHRHRGALSPFRLSQRGAERAGGRFGD